MVYHRAAIERALVENTPRIAAVDPDLFVVRNDYRNADWDDLLAGFGRSIRRLGALLLSLDEAAVGRALIVDDPPQQVDVAFVARSAIHEGVHHLGDIERLTTA